MSWSDDSARWCRADAVDTFRVCAGCAVLLYFARLAFDLGGGRGLGALLYGDVTVGFFEFGRAWVVEGEVLGVMIAFVGAVSGLCITIGARPRISAVAGFLVSVVVCQLNAAVASIDDHFVRVLFLWIAAFPLGHSLVMGRGRGKHVMVERSVIQAFLVNIALVYLVAGGWKWTSEYWRSGYALYVVEQMPCGRFSEIVSPSVMHWLVVPTYVALVLETSLPLMLCARGLWLRRCGVVAQLGFHLGIVATLDIPIVNLALLSSSILFLRCGFQRDSSTHGVTQATYIRSSRWTKAAVWTYVVLLSFSFLAQAFGHSLATRWVGGGLHLVGLSQHYRLFDWVGERAYRRTLSATVTAADGTQREIDPGELVPDTLRGEILLTYLDGYPWKPLPPDRLAVFQASLRSRIAARYCKRNPTRDKVTLMAKMEWFEPPDPRPAWIKNLELVSFHCGTKA